ncbi:hypothetical protein EV184_104145 [Sinorhizobium americanum]|uniref:Uncharacterized protein n=2 Tax=Sinorhizobium americanum TaxID=194963 RepID=A0A4R2C1V3_9HYPH|nr:hypothetical protein EV184_104145 [Sinorhizobium americanum]
MSRAFSILLVLVAAFWWSAAEASENCVDSPQFFENAYSNFKMRNRCPYAVTAYYKMEYKGKVEDKQLFISGCGGTGFDQYFKGSRFFDFRISYKENYGACGVNNSESSNSDTGSSLTGDSASPSEQRNILNKILQETLAKTRDTAERERQKLGNLENNLELQRSHDQQQPNNVLSDEELGEAVRNNMENTRQQMQSEGIVLSDEELGYPPGCKNKYSYDMCAIHGKGCSFGDRVRCRAICYGLCEDPL